MKTCYFLNCLPTDWIPVSLNQFLKITYLFERFTLVHWLFLVSFIMKFLEVINETKFKSLAVRTSFAWILLLVN